MNIKMKKRYLKLILIMIMGCTFMIPINSIKAYEKNNLECSYYNIIQITDDLYEETIIYENILARATKSGTKTVNYRNAAGNIVWSVSVHGNFTYNGSTSSCTSSTVSTTCPSSVWRIISKSARKSGSVAIGEATAKLYSNGIPIQTLTREVRLTCSKSGTLS